MVKAWVATFNQWLCQAFAWDSWDVRWRQSSCLVKEICIENCILGQFFTIWSQHTPSLRTIEPRKGRDCQGYQSVSLNLHTAHRWTMMYIAQIGSGTINITATKNVLFSLPRGWNSWHRASFGAVPQHLKEDWAPRRLLAFGGCGSKKSQWQQCNWAGKQGWDKSTKAAPNACRGKPCYHPGQCISRTKF